MPVIGECTPLLERLIKKSDMTIPVPFHTVLKPNEEIPPQIDPNHIVYVRNPVYFAERQQYQRVQRGALLVASVGIELLLYASTRKGREHMWEFLKIIRFITAK